MKRIMMTLAILVPMAPVHGQTIVDTFSRLRSTLKQLGAKPNSPGAPADAPTKSTGQSPVGAGDADRLVPGSAMVDDVSDSFLENSRLVPRRVISFDVRGLKLGMSPREVGRVADRQHFRHHWNQVFLTSGTFELEAARMANYQLDRPIERTSKIQLKEIQGSDPDGDELELDFTIDPSGPKLSRIQYTARLNGSNRAQAVEGLVRKYGPPDGGNVRNALEWSNRTKPVDTSSPSLIATIDGPVLSVTLMQSTDYLQNAKKVLHDRAQQLASSKGGGIKF